MIWRAKFRESIRKHQCAKEVGIRSFLQATKEQSGLQGNLVVYGSLHKNVICIFLYQFSLCRMNPITVICSKDFITGFLLNTVVNEWLTGPDFLCVKEKMNDHIDTWGVHTYDPITHGMGGSGGAQMPTSRAHGIPIRRINMFSYFSILKELSYCPAPFRLPRFSAKLSRMCLSPPLFCLTVFSWGFGSFHSVGVSSVTSS